MSVFDMLKCEHLFEYVGLTSLPIFSKDSIEVKVFKCKTCKELKFEVD